MYLSTVKVEVELKYRAVPYGLLKQLTKALVERALDAEMDVHLDDPKYKTGGKAKRDRRNGHSQKTLKGEFGTASLSL